MLAILNTGGGHTPEQTSKQNQTDPGTTGCPYTDTTLLPALRQHGKSVDQEAIHIPQGGPP